MEEQLQNFYKELYEEELDSNQEELDSDEEELDKMNEDKLDLDEEIRDFDEDELDSYDEDSSSSSDEDSFSSYDEDELEKLREKEREEEREKEREKEWAAYEEEREKQREKEWDASPRFYIPTVNYLANNIELFIFFYLLYHFVIEILLYLIIWILQMIKYRDEQLEQTIYDCANLFHFLMLTCTLLLFNGYFLPGLFLISIISIIILFFKIIKHFLD